MTSINFCMTVVTGSCRLLNFMQINYSTFANDQQLSSHKRHEQTLIFFQQCFLSKFISLVALSVNIKSDKLQAPSCSRSHRLGQGMTKEGSRGEVTVARKAKPSRLVSAHGPTGCETGSRVQCVPGLCAGNDSGTPAGLVSQGVAWHSAIREPQSDMPHGTDCTHAPLSRLLLQPEAERCGMKNRHGVVLMAISQSWGHTAKWCKVQSEMNNIIHVKVQVQNISCQFSEI